MALAGRWLSTHLLVSIQLRVTVRPPQPLQEPSGAVPSPRVVLQPALVRLLPRADACACPRSVLVAWPRRAEPCCLARGLVLRTRVLL